MRPAEPLRTGHSRRSTRFLLSVALFLCFGAVACATPPPAAGPTPTATATPAPDLREIVESRITAASILSHVEFLASDELLGRDTPSPGLERAAQYLSDHFERAGLTPAGDAGTFVQRWPFQRVVLDTAGSEALMRSGGEEIAWRYGAEYFAFPAPPVRLEGVPVYAPTPESVASGLPNETSGRPVLAYLPNGLGPDFTVVVQAALTAGASGIVVILDEATEASEISQLSAALESGAAGQAPVPVVGLRYDVGADLLRAAGIDAPGGGGEPLSLDGVTLSILTTFESRVDQVPNVVAVLPGSDPSLSGSYVVLTAHYDHVGVGPADADGDSIFNGADDNASGTSVLMMVAEALAALPTAPPRSVLFLAVSGEEKGLLGSSHFAGDPTVELSGIVANINMDMVGRNHPDTIYGIGTEFTTIGEVAERVAAEHPELGLVLAPDPEPEEQVFLRSDHYSFVEEGIPAFMLTTWLHDDYHAQSDHADLVDADKAARVARLIFYLTLEVASDPLAPAWTPEGEALLRTLSGF